MHTHRRILPFWCRTVGSAIDNGVVVRVACDSCHSVFDVDLRAIAAARGRAHSLVDARPLCKLTACRGSAYFLAARSMAEPFLTLISRDEDPLCIRGRRPIDFEPPDGAPPAGETARSTTA